MVFTNSDSCNTLVSLDGDHKSSGQPLSSSYYVAAAEADLVCTSILLPTDDDEGDEYLHLPSSTYSDDNNNNCGSGSSSLAVDEYLNTVPCVSGRADELLTVAPRLYSSDSNEIVLNVCQGEVAHATTSECDVVVSTDATTCHILALRSCCSGTNSQPLTSVTHIDSAGYESCVESMFRMHKSHHHHHNNHVVSSSLENNNVIDMDVHIVGGFNDEEGHSRAITEFLFKLLSRIAREESQYIRLTLQTCAVTSMNDTGFFSPIGRGFAVDTRTGDAFLAHVEGTALGPAVSLRSCRLWAGHGDKLHVVHTPNNNNRKKQQQSSSSTIVVQPFVYKAFRDIDTILRLPDHVLLQHTSTSPDCEGDNFCDNLRRTFLFMKKVNCHQVFGNDVDKPAVYTRTSRNVWVATYDGGP